MTVIVTAPAVMPTISGEQANADVIAAVGDQVTAIKSSADGWQKGLAGLLTLLTSVLFLKGKDSVAKLAPDYQYLAATLLIAAAIAAVAATFLLLRAAQGAPKDTDLEKVRAEGIYIWRYKKAHQAAANLRRGQAFILLMLALFASAVLVSWFGKGPGSEFQVILSTTGACGELAKADNGQFKITEDAQKVSMVPADQLASLNVVEKCP